MNLANETTDMIEIVKPAPVNNNGAHVAKKIAKIMGDMGPIRKDGVQKQFKYIKGDDILADCRAHLSANSLAIIPMVLGKQRIDDEWLIQYQFMIIDGETGDTVIAPWEHSIPAISTTTWKNKDGSQESRTYIDDKADGKAVSYAHKYFLMKLFMISDKDTPDLDDTPPNSYPAQRQADDFIPAGTPAPAPSGTAQAKQTIQKHAGGDTLASHPALRGPFMVDMDARYGANSKVIGDLLGALSKCDMTPAAAEQVVQNWAADQAPPIGQQSDNNRTSVYQQPDSAAPKA